MATGDDKWEVYNHTGDRVTSLVTASSPEAEAAEWPSDAEALLTREEALLALEERVTQSGLAGGTLSGDNEGATLWVGDVAQFTYMPAATQTRYLTLFNIAANGVVQPLFPVDGDGAVGGAGITLPFDVKPPVGADRLVAVSCPAQPTGFRARLSALANQAAQPSLFADPDIADCDLTSLGVFTANRAQ